MFRVAPETLNSPVSQGAQSAARSRDPQSGGFSALVDDNAQNIDRSAQRASTDRAPDAPRADNRDLPARPDNAAPAAAADRNTSASQRTDAPKTGKSDDGTGHHAKTKGAKTDRADQDAQAATNTDAATVAPADPAATIIVSADAAKLAASGVVVAQADGVKSDAASTGDNSDAAAAVTAAITTPVAAVTTGIVATIPVISADTQVIAPADAQATAIQSVATGTDAPAATAVLPADATVAVETATDVTAKAAKATIADVLTATPDAAPADAEGEVATGTQAQHATTAPAKAKTDGGTVIDSSLSLDAKDTDKPATLPLPAHNADASAPREADAPQHGKHSASPDKSESAATDAKQAATPTPVEHRAPVAAHASLPGDTGAPPVQVPQPQTSHLQAPNLTVTPAQINTALASTPVPVNGIAVDIALRAAGGASRFEIRLDPAELGRIDVRLDVDRHGNVTSHLTVEKPSTLDMLRQDAPRLQQALEDAGLKTGDSGLQFSLRDQSSSNGRGDDNGSGRNAHRLIISEDDTVPAQIAGRTYGRAPGSGSGVDIRV